MCLDRLDRSLGLVVTVHVGRDLLMCAFPYLCGGFDVGCAGFIVKYLCVHFDAPFLETFHDGVIGWGAMLVCF